MNDLNSESNKKLRRYRDSLLSDGKIYILFGLWSVIRAFIELTMRKEVYDFLVDSVRKEVNDDSYIRIGIFFAFFIVAFSIFIFHYALGRYAIKISKKNRISILFFVFTAIFIAFSSLIVIGGIRRFFTPDNPDNDTFVASVLLDVTGFLILADMFFSSLMINILSGKQKKEDGRIQNAG